MLLEPGELISIQSAYDGRFLEGLDGMDNAAHTVLLDRQGRTLVPALWQKLEVNPQQVTSWATKSAALATRRRKPCAHCTT